MGIKMLIIALLINLNQNLNQRVFHRDYLGIEMFYTLNDSLFVDFSRR